MQETIPWLIATDLDGTLLTNEDAAGRRGLPSALFVLLRRLQKKGVICCIASGRFAGSLFTLFEENLDSLYFASENGAQLYHGTDLIDEITMPYDACRELAAEVSGRSDCVLRINTTKARYFLVKNEEAAEEMRQWKYSDPYEMTTALSFDDIEGAITQMTAISFGDIRPIAEVLTPRWKDTLFPAITGEHWLDFTCAGKGLVIEKLCRHLGIPRDHVIAFGDNYNDTSMLDYAARGYIMNWADPSLVKRYRYRSGGVIETLTFLDEIGLFD